MRGNLELWHSLEKKFEMIAILPQKSIFYSTIILLISTNSRFLTYKKISGLGTAIFDSKQDSSLSNFVKTSCNSDRVHACLSSFKSLPRNS